MVDVVYIVAILLAVVFLEYVKLSEVMKISWKLLVLTTIILFLSATFEFWGTYILQLVAWVMLLIITIVGALELFGLLGTKSM